MLGLVASWAVAESQQTDSCAGLTDSALTLCRASQQAVRQQQIEQQLRQQEERQNQLDRQQREVQQQLDSMRQQNEAMRQQNETMRLQNESLRKDLERESAAPRARVAMAGAPDPARNQDLNNWKAGNPWFGTDYARTQFAMRYIKQLEKERPELGGRELLDAVSAKVNEQFGASR